MATKITQSRLYKTIASTFERKRTGPYHRQHRDLIAGLVSMRERIAGEPSKDVRSFLEYCLPRMMKSRSQLFQDLFVEFVLDGKKNGYFCEFGATDGVSLSNSSYLESELGWRGICAEPAHGWHEVLAKNRPLAIIDHRCVWTETGEELTFAEADERTLSSLSGFADSDGRGSKRAKGRSYNVKTISLTDLLDDHHAPKDLDFISIDTEGSELAILTAFDFDIYRPKILAIEHNFMPVRNDILALMTAKNYRRVLTQCSQWDDWYLENSLPSNLQTA